MQNSIKKLITISFAAFFIFFYIFVALENSYLAHIYYTNIFAHSISLMIICSFAFSIFYFYHKSYTQNKDKLCFAGALCFEILGIYLFFHSITIPSFYFLNEHIFDITEHLGLLLAGLALMILFLPTRFVEGFCYHYRKKIAYSIAFASVIGIILFFIFPGFSEILARYINSFIFLSGVFLLVGIIKIFKDARMILKCKAHFYLVVGLSILINAAIIPFFYKEWNLIWWYFHLAILVSELVVFFGVLKKYNENNRF